MIDVSVIIVNYKSSALVNDCIRSIFEKTEGVTYEIIVVDNATEDLSETLEAANDERVKILQLKENVGFGRANNAGAELAKGRNLFLLNPDTVLLNNAIKILSDYLYEHEEAGAVGGNLYSKDMDAGFSYQRYFPGIFWELDNLFVNRLNYRFYKDPFFNTSDNIIDVKFVMGADIMLRRTDFEKIDGFDSNFFMYFEETDLCVRIMRVLKKRNKNIPQAKIQHLEGGTTDGDSNYVFNPVKCMIWEHSRKLFFKNNHPWISRIISNIILRFNLFIKSIVLPSKKGRDGYRNALKIHLKEWSI